MYKFIKVFMCNVLLLTILTASNHAYAGRKEVHKAKEFIRAGMYIQAQALLEREIYGYRDNKNREVQGNPTNSEAQFLLAVVFIKQGRIDQANDRFNSAIQLNPKLGDRIGSEYRSEGNKLISQRQVDNAVKYMNQSIRYQPNLRKSVGFDYRNQAILALSRNDYDSAIKLLKYMSVVVPMYRSDAGTILFSAGKDTIAFDRENGDALMNEGLKYNSDLLNDYYDIGINLLKTSTNEKEIFKHYLNLKDKYKDRKSDIDSVLLTKGKDIKVTLTPQNTNYGKSYIKVSAVQEGQRWAYTSCDTDFRSQVTQYESSYWSDITTDICKKLSIWKADKSGNLQITLPESSNETVNVTITMFSN